jgi:hypothetical protein
VSAAAAALVRAADFINSRRSIGFLWLPEIAYLRREERALEKVGEQAKEILRFWLRQDDGIENLHRNDGYLTRAWVGRDILIFPV